jgi:hypothetical protein
MTMFLKLLTIAATFSYLPFASAAIVFTENFETTSAGGPGVQAAPRAISSPGTPNEYRFGELNHGGLADPSRNFTLPGWTIETGATINANGVGSKVYVQRDNDGGTTANTAGNGALAGMPNDAAGDLWLLLDRRGANATLGVGNGAYLSPTVIAASSVYTLALTVGKRGDLGLPPEFQFGLWAGAGATPDAAIIGAVLDQTAYDAPTPSGGGTAQAFNIVLDTSDPTNAGLIGQNLFLRFFVPGSAGGTAALQVGFNDVSLDVVAIPEPTTMIIAVLALLGALPASRRWARRVPQIGE